jgi:hypothetical protein
MFGFDTNTDGHCSAFDGVDVALFASAENTSGRAFEITAIPVADVAAAIGEAWRYRCEHYPAVRRDAPVLIYFELRERPPAWGTLAQTSREMRCGASRRRFARVRLDEVEAERSAQRSIEVMIRLNQEDRRQVAAHFGVIPSGRILAAELRLTMERVLRGSPSTPAS